MTKKPLIIAIDGPAASGKGTLARKLAAHLNIPYLDTGKLYRAVAFSLVSQHIDPHNVEAATHAANTLTPAMLQEGALTEERIGQAASIVAAMPPVREALIAFQRNFAKSPEGAVIDGRDIGTVICPDADIKLFIVASVEVRAKRRYEEMQAKGIPLAYEAVLHDLQERDERDMSRDTAPLKAAEDAIVIDTSLMDANDVVVHVLHHCF